MGPYHSKAPAQRAWGAFWGFPAYVILRGVWAVFVSVCERDVQGVRELHRHTQQEIEVGGCCLGPYQAKEPPQRVWGAFWRFPAYVILSCVCVCGQCECVCARVCACASAVCGVSWPQCVTMFVSIHQTHTQQLVRLFGPPPHPNTGKQVKSSFHTMHVQPTRTRATQIPASMCHTLQGPVRALLYIMICPVHAVRALYSKK
jgi:hypothetical protein